MNRRFFLGAAAACAAPFLGGATTTIDFGDGEGRASLLIAGSDEFHPYAVRLVAGFAEIEPTIDTLVETGGTDPGLLALRRGAIDIALSSRELKPSEDDKATRATLVARDAIALVVHPGNPVRDLDGAQAVALLRGEFTDWSDVGGVSGDVRLYRRKAATGTQKALEKLVLDHAEPAPTARTVESGVEMREAVGRDRLAFGFLALHDVTPAVKVLDVNGIPLGRPTILSGRYPYARSFFLVTRGEPDGAVGKFLSYATSRRGQSLLAGLGLIPVR